MYSIQSIISAWDNFFFKPQATEGIALFRIVWCTLMLSYLFFDIGNIYDFYGPHSILSLETVKRQFTYPHMNIFHLFGSSYETVYLMMFIYGLALISAILGFRTRMSLFIVLVCMTSFHQRNIWLLSSSELLMRTITIMLLCSPSGNSLSIDSLLEKKEREWAPWALRLIQIQVSVVYIWTVWHKLKGHTWIDGTAVYYASRLESMTNFPVPFFLDNLAFIKMSTWGTLLVELSLGVLIWIKEFRRPAIIIGILFHIGIEYMMSIPFFELAMMALLINFYTPEEHRKFIANLKTRLILVLDEVSLAESMKNKIRSVLDDAPLSGSIEKS